jgi:hypothetical protein
MNIKLVYGYLRLLKERKKPTMKLQHKGDVLRDLRGA